MWRVAWAGAVRHKLRYALTALAVVLGVAFTTGTLVFTDTIGRTFDGLFGDIYAHVAVSVRASEQFSGGASFTSTRDTIDRQLVDRVAVVPGVDRVGVSVGGYAQLVDASGHPIGHPEQGAPTLGGNWVDVPALNPYRLLPGSHPPRSSTEIVIDEQSARVGNFSVGDVVEVLTRNAPARYTIVGTARWGNADSPLGASVVLFDTATAERVLGTPGRVDEIVATRTSDVTDRQLADRVRAALGDGHLEVLTGAQVADQGKDQVRRAMGFFNTFLLVFGLIALFVSAFLIFNTFSIVVSQRMRELALLRAVGASRTQVTGSVVGEAVLIGAVAAVVGLGAGVGLAVALRGLLVLFGIDIPATGLVLSLPTVLVSLALGLGITVAAAVLPAWRAGRVPPVAAITGTSLRSTRNGVGLAVAGGTTTALGVAALSVGLFTGVGHRVLVVGVGAAVTFVGLAALGPFVSRPLSQVLGAPFRRRLTGRLARDNTMRSARRTSATAAALMVGVALVAVMSVLASSTKASIDSAVDRAMRADFIVSTLADPTTGTGFSPALRDQLAALPEVAVANAVRAQTAEVHGQQQLVLAVDTTHVGDVFDVGTVTGDLGATGATDVALSTRKAEAWGLRLGDTVPLVFARTGPTRLRLVATYTDWQVAGDVVVPMAVADADFSSALDFQVHVLLADGVSTAAGRAAVQRALAAYPNAHLSDRTGYKKARSQQVDQMLNLVYGLLGLALTIALIGIANTLALSVNERVRELGLLRAVGMTRAQTRAMVRGESVLIAAQGAILGLVIGTLLGVALVAALHDIGIDTLSVPVVQLVVVAVVAAGAGVLAAIGPARRAARLDVLAALATE